jgi:hypothetical protein
VTKPKWEAVYEETVQLIKNLPLAERRQVDIHGVNTMYLVKTEERDFTSLWKVQEEKEAGLQMVILQEDSVKGQWE